MHCCDASQTIHCGVDGKRPVKIGKTSDWRVGCHQNLLRLQPCGLASPTDCKRRIWGEQGCSSAICASYSTAVAVAMNWMNAVHYTRLEAVSVCSFKPACFSPAPKNSPKTILWFISASLTNQSPLTPSAQTAKILLPQDASKRKWHHL